MTPRRLFSSLVTGLGAVMVLTGCPTAPIVLAVALQNPAPLVGQSTPLRLEVEAGWFRNPIFYYKAQRGTIVGMNGERATPGNYVRAGNQVTYFAPFTSNFIGPAGIQNNDTIQIMVQDGQYITNATQVVNVSGSTVVFSTAPASGQNGTIMISTDTGGGQLSAPQPLRDLNNQPIQGTSPVISPSGNRIAYVFYPGDGTSKIMMRDTGGQVLALTNDAKGLALDPAWSPDGAFLLYASNHETSGATFDIYMIAVDSSTGGNAVTRLTNTSWDNRHPAWNPVISAPEAQMIAVASRKNSLPDPGGLQQNWNVFLMNRSGSYTRAISQIQGDGTNWACEPSWSPDGATIAYTRNGPVNNYQSSAAAFQRIFVQQIQSSLTYTPLNTSNTDPNSRESSPIWATDQTNSIIFLRADGAGNNNAMIYRTTYQPGGTNTFPPLLVAPFQGLYLPLTTVGGTNRDVSGAHPLDWR